MGVAAKSDSLSPILLPHLVCDAMDDLDVDGCCNMAEFLRGTLPKDPSSIAVKAMPWITLLLLNG